MAPNGRKCQNCGKRLVIRKGERPATFAKRVTCSRTCGLLIGRRTKKYTVTKPSEDTVRAIKWMLVDEIALEVIAERFNVSVSLIKRIKAGTAYREVEI